MTRIEREKQTVRKMIGLYCSHRLKADTIPEAYQHLADFACRRLDHCYPPTEREQIREVMRWTGPRMILYSPIAAIRHLFNK